MSNHLGRIAKIGFMAAVLLAGPLAFAGAATLSGPPRMFLLGDSIMLQYSPALTQILSPLWQIEGKTDSADAPPALHNLDVPTGRNAGDSAMVVAYLQARHDRAPINANVLLLNCGLHDIKTDIITGKHQVDLAQYKENLVKIIELAGAMKLQIVWVRTTPVIDEVHNQRDGIGFFRYARDVEAYNLAADEIMARHQVAIIDLFSFSSHFVPTAFADHVHYNHRLQEMQASYVAGCITAWFRPPDGSGATAKYGTRAKRNAGLANQVNVKSAFSKNPSIRLSGGSVSRQSNARILEECYRGCCERAQIKLG